MFSSEAPGSPGSKAKFAGGGKSATLRAAAAGAGGREMLERLGCGNGDLKWRNGEFMVIDSVLTWWRQTPRSPTPK